MKNRTNHFLLTLAVLGSTGIAACSEYSVATDDGNSRTTHLSYTVQQDPNATECNEANIGSNYADCVSFLATSMDFSEPDDARNPCAACGDARQAVVDAIKGARAEWATAKDKCPARNPDSRKADARACAKARHEFLAHNDALRMARESLDACRASHSCRKIGLERSILSREAVRLV